ncbi:MAG: C_GCAxxG_C_C family protein [Candidatus Bathyarchaeota archaeon]|nr:MAG: C_GCAxxG_C_C family protein [Candidatus Bathyarchaeota archaeon]
MLSREDTIRLAAGYTDRGFLCSESVLLALSDCLDISSDVIPRIATGFGAGVGRSGEICGALAGAVMGLGLKYGRDEVGEEEHGPGRYWYSTEILKRFRAEHGDVRCKNLLDLDLSRAEDKLEYDNRRLWETVCREFIVEATGLAYDILAREV